MVFGTGSCSTGSGDARTPFPYAHPYLSLFQYLGKLHIGAVGEERVILQFGADRGEVYLRNVVHEDYQMRVSHGYGSTRIAYAVYFDGMFCHRLAPLAVIVHGFVRRNTHVNGYSVYFIACRV